MYIFSKKKKRVQIWQVSVKLVISIEKYWMKVEQVQLFYNLMDGFKIVKFFKIHCPVFTFPFN